MALHKSYLHNISSYVFHCPELILPVPLFLQLYIHHNFHSQPNSISTPIFFYTIQYTPSPSIGNFILSFTFNEEICYCVTGNIKYTAQCGQRLK